MNILGQCLCGCIRYEVKEPPLEMLNCHCSMCRKAHGAAFATWLAVRKKDCVIVGEAYLQPYKSSQTVMRQFCKECGSSLFWQNCNISSILWIAAGTLDTDPGICPGKHIFSKDKASWYTITDNLPRIH